MIFADINTANPDRHSKNWGVLLKENNAQLAPNFDYDMTFCQTQYAMQGIAESIENKDKKFFQKIIKKYNIRRFTHYLKETVQQIGLELGEGQRFMVDMEGEKYSIKDTCKYIQRELGDKAYSELVSTLDIKSALPEIENKEYEIYSLIAKLHDCNTRSKIAVPNKDTQER